MSFIFAQENLVASTATIIKKIGANSKAMVDITVCKTSPGDAAVNVSVSVGETTTFLEHGARVPNGTPLLKTKEMFPPNATIKIEADSDGVDVTLAGIEIDATSQVSSPVHFDFILSWITGAPRSATQLLDAVPEPGDFPLTISGSPCLTLATGDTIAFDPTMFAAGMINSSSGTATLSLDAATGLVSVTAGGTLWNLVMDGITFYCSEKGGDILFSSQGGYNGRISAADPLTMWDATQDVSHPLVTAGFSTGTKYNNLFTYSSDFNEDVWGLYDVPAATEIGGVVTLTQNVAGTSFIFKRNNLGSDPEIGLGSYVLRFKYNLKRGAELTPDLITRITGVFDPETGAGPSNIQIQSFTNDWIEWTRLQLPFRPDTGSDLFVYDAAFALKDLDIENIQVCDYTGVAVYSTGDTICARAFSYDNNIPSVRNYDHANCYTEMFAYDTRLVSKNVGVSGETLLQIYNRMVTDLAGKTYPLGIIEGGLNDLSGTSLADMQTHMTNIITLAKTKFDKTVILNIPPEYRDYQIHKDYNDWLALECAAQGVQMIDVLALLGDGSGAYGTGRNYIYYGKQHPSFEDAATEIHPNPVGHKVIADYLLANVTLPASAIALQLGDTITTGAMGLTVDATTLIPASGSKDAAGHDTTNPSGQFNQAPVKYTFDAGAEEMIAADANWNFFFTSAGDPIPRAETEFDFSVTGLNQYWFSPLRGLIVDTSPLTGNTLSARKSYMGLL